MGPGLLLKIEAGGSCEEEVGRGAQEPGGCLGQI